MKKTLTVFAALMLVALAVPHSALAYNFYAVAPSGQTLYYNIVGGVAHVTTQNNNDPYYNSNSYPTGDLVIPSNVTYNGNTYSVTSIGNNAFYNCSGLTSVTIPNSVTSIGNSFLYCSGLTSVVFNADSCAIPTSSRPFSGCNNISSFTFGDSVRYIPAYICYNLTGLTSVTIPNSVTSIGQQAFSYCSGLTSVNFNADSCAILTDPSRRPFYGCNNISSFIFGDSVRYIPAWLCSGLTGLTSVTIPNSVTSIGNAAFSSCSGLSSVSIPNSVTSIGQDAFYGCTGLTSVTIPNSVTSIGNYAFKNCSGLSSVSIGGSVTSIGQQAFSYCSGLSSVTIPNSVTSIGGEAFQNCSGLTSVTIGGSVTSISNYTFYGCSGLTSVTIPNSVTSIGNSAFSGCSGLTSVTIPNSVTSISNYAFSNCSGLTSVTIPNSVTSIGGGAFQSCSGLTSVVFNADSCTGVEANTNSPFSGCSNITSFVFSNSVRYIPAYICRDLSGLTSVTIGENVSSIGAGAFLYTGFSGSDTIYIFAEMPPAITSTTFQGVPTNVRIRVPCGTLEDYQEADYWNSFTRISEDQSCYTLVTAVPNNAAYGSVSGGGRYSVGNIATLSAMPHNGYAFTGWADGGTDNPRLVLVSGDMTYTANFAPAVLAPIHDTAYIYVHDTTYMDVFVHDTTTVTIVDTLTLTEYVPVHDTTYIDVPYAVHDTTIVTLTDTVTLTEYVPVHDTTVVTLTDTVTNTVYDTVTNTVFDTVVNMVYDTVDNYIYDTTVVTDTLWLTLYDTVYITDTVIIHDTVYVPENGIDEVQTASIRLYQRDGQIVVEDADGGVLPEVAVYDAVGRKMRGERRVGGGKAEMPVPVSGVYMVKIGDMPARRVVVVR